MYSSSIMVNSDGNNGSNTGSPMDNHHNHMSSSSSSPSGGVIDIGRSRYPLCIVWTPIPLLTWLVPLIGHMGIGTSAGVIRDFAGSYFVSQDEMAFGQPTKYWKLGVDKVVDGQQGWDEAVKHASDIYMHRMVGEMIMIVIECQFILMLFILVQHNLFCDNCHSHVALALNLMRYDGKSNHNMIKLWFLFMIHAKYVR